ncbi:phospholipase-like protein [Tanacetum coccineum]
MPNDVYKGNVVSAKEGRLDVLIQVVCDGKGIDKADGYSQLDPSTLTALIEGFDSQNNNPGIDFLQRDCSVAKPNDHPTADIGVKPLLENEFDDDFIELLNDEESLPTVSLDDINVDEQEEKLIDTIKVESNKSESVKERKKRLAMALESPFGQQPPTTPVPPKFISRSVNCDFILPPDFEEDVSGQPKMRSINELMTMEVFVEQLSRPQNCKKDKVSMPDGLAEYLQMEDPPNYRFPWGYRDITVDREFCTLIYGWISCGVLDNPTQIGPWYPVAWRDVEKVYFPVNEPKRHWCLAELHITTGLVTFYDSLGWVSSNRRHWWQNMKRTLPQQLTLYLYEHGVLQSKGIAVKRYEITYKFPTVIEQARFYRDCGIWVCIFPYRLSRNLPLPVNEPLQTALAYRERILQYFWTHKIEAKKSLIFNQVKSLLQFRTVSKSWKSYIDSTAFFFNYGVRKPVNDVFYLAYNQGRLGYMIYVDANLIHTQALANLDVTNLKPVGTSNRILCFSFGNNMMVCIVNLSIGKKDWVFVPTTKPDRSKILLGFGVRPDNLDPTVLKISYPSSREGNWSVDVFTLSALRWFQLDMNHLPRESIRFRWSTQAVVGEFIYWVGYERVFDDIGDSYKHYLLVSFDMINHRFQEIAISNLLMRGLDSLLYVSKLRNSIVLSGNIPTPEYYVFVCCQLSINGGFITLFPAIMTMPTHHFTKLLGFNNKDKPILEAATIDIMGHRV